jgi:hypothetical protein
LAHVDNTPTRGWRPRHSGDTCDATWWPNLGFCWIPWCAVMFSSTLGGACQRMMVGFSPAIICFFPLLFSLPRDKVHLYSLCFLFFNFSPHSFNFLFCFYSFYRCFFVLQFNHSITLSHMFYFSPHSFNFLFHFYSF